MCPPKLLNAASLADLSGTIDKQGIAPFSFEEFFKSFLYFPPNHDSFYLSESRYTTSFGKMSMPKNHFSDKMLYSKRPHPDKMH